MDKSETKSKQSIVDHFKSFQVLIAVFAGLITLYFTTNTYVGALEDAQKFQLKHESISLLKSLGSNNPVEKRGAAAALITLGPDILPILLEHMKFPYRPEDYDSLTISIDYILEEARCKNVLENEFDASFAERISTFINKHGYMLDCEEQWFYLMEDIHARIFQIIDLELETLQVEKIVAKSPMIMRQINLLKLLERKNIPELTGLKLTKKIPYLKTKFVNLKTSKNTVSHSDIDKFIVVLSVSY